MIDKIGALRTLLATLGARAAAVVTGPVTGTRTVIEYLKQLVTAIYRLTETACADIVDPVDMTTEVADNTVVANVLTNDGNTSDFDRRTDSLEALSDKLVEIESQIQAIVSAYFATTTVINSSVTLATISAIGGPKSDIVIDFLLDDDAAATFTPAWYINSLTAPLTYVVQNIPAIATIVTPAADGRYRYEFPGILAQGFTLEFRIAQNNAGDATNAIEGSLSYKE